MFKDRGKVRDTSINFRMVLGENREIETNGFVMYKCIETFYKFTKKNEITGEGLDNLLQLIGFEKNPIYDVSHFLKI